MYEKNSPNRFPQEMFEQIFAKFSKLIFNILRWARRALLLGPTVEAEGCRPPQELEKAARRAAIFLVYNDCYKFPSQDFSAENSTTTASPEESKCPEGFEYNEGLNVCDDIDEVRVAHRKEPI